MGSLAAVLLPLIPGLVSGVASVVNAIRNHPTTPDDVKAQLDQISADLHAVNVRVQAVELPS